MGKRITVLTLVLALAQGNAWAADVGFFGFEAMLRKSNNDNLNTIALYNLDAEALLTSKTCEFLVLPSATYLLCDQKQLNKLINYKGVKQ